MHANIVLFAKTKEEERSEQDQSSAPPGTEASEHNKQGMHAVKESEEHNHNGPVVRSPEHEQLDNTEERHDEGKDGCTKDGAGEQQTPVGRCAKDVRNAVEKRPRCCAEGGATLGAGNGP